MSFNDRLRKLRENKSVKQREVADFIGVSERVYGYYEKDRFPKDEAVLQKLAEYFDVPVSYLLSGKIDTEGRAAIKDPAYFRVMLYAEQKGISPEDIEDAILLLERARKRDKKEKEDKG
ncbi:MAG TPA: helix-turn-helix transcriptional regulator [Clostridia bacterium]